MVLTENDVARILKLIDESQFDEVRMEFADLKIYVRRSGAAAPAPAQPFADLPQVLALAGFARTHRRSGRV